LNKILVSVHGPIEPIKRGEPRANDLGFVSVHFVNAPFSGNERKKRKPGSQRVHEIESVVKQTFESVILLENYQKSEISVIIHAFETDGSLVCCVINGVTLALMDAGIAMKEMVVASSIGLLRQQFYHDLTQIEQNSGSAYLPVAILSHNKEIVFMQLDSRISVDLMESAIEAAIQGCCKIRVIIETIIRDCLRETHQAHKLIK
jgi:exosome complex component RRP41